MVSHRDEVMNKYEEVLKDIKNTRVWVEDIFDWDNVFEEDDERFDLLDELVKRATPMKPLNMITTHYGLSVGDCPICKSTVVELRGCAKCLQAIDWSE
jgi:hypothetical protein